MSIKRLCVQPDDDFLPLLPLRTLPRKFKGRCIITCNEFFETDVHFIGGRTLPCLQEDCQACLAARPRKYEAYLSVLWVTTRRHEMLRLTKPATLQLKSQQCSKNSPRGLPLLLERKGERPNGPVEVVVESNEINLAALPASPDLLQHLARIWRVDGISVTTGEKEYVDRLGSWIDKIILKGSEFDA